LPRILFRKLVVQQTSNARDIDGMGKCGLELFGDAYLPTSETTLF